MEYCRHLISKLGKVQILYLGDEGTHKPLRLTSQQCEGCGVLLPPGLDASQTRARVIQGSMASGAGKMRQFRSSIGSLSWQDRPMYTFIGHIINPNLMHV